MACRPNPRATCHIAGCCHPAISMSWSHSYVTTCHIAGCCHWANSLSWFQSHMPHCRVLPPGKFNDTLSQSHVSRCRVGLLSLGEFTVMIPEPHCRVQSMSWSCHIAERKNSIRHIENRFSPYFIIFVFLMQFGLSRTAAFISSPIHDSG